MKTLVENKKARFEYFINETITCGMVLTSKQVKAIVNGKVNIADRFCWHNNGLIVANIGILDGVEQIPLLVNKNEKKRIQEAFETKSYTVVPYKIFRANNHLIKLEVAICKGKHEYDKREAIKARESQREINRAKRYGF